jgi:hypothetical protein
VICCGGQLFAEDQPSQFTFQLFSFQVIVWSEQLLGERKEALLLVLSLFNSGTYRAKSHAQNSLTL